MKSPTLTDEWSWRRVSVIGTRTARDKAMRILLTHGYLLTGTGSNLYVNNLARELCRAGHDVRLVCQEFHPERIDHVEAVYGFENRNAELVEMHLKETPYPGKCTVFRPEIEELLPVYVFDHYDGFEVKEFPACSDAEIQNYADLNRRALITVLGAFPVDVIQSNHAILFPYIVARLPERYPHHVTLHGSALNFSVKRDPRLAAHAREGLRSATRIIVDSLHAREELREFLDGHGDGELMDRVEIIPAGVDVERFDVLQAPKKTYVEAFARNIGSAASRGQGRTAAETARMFEGPARDPAAARARIREVRAGYDYRFVDHDVAEKISAIDWNRDRVVFFAGKYLWTKGIHLLLLAAPLILERHPNTKFVLVGFGPFREVAEQLLHCLASGRLDLLHAFAEAEEPPVPLLSENLERNAEALRRALATTAHLLPEAVVFTGILDHESLGHLLPLADVLVAPSVFPEAFGMVAVEALACGVLPVVTFQSSFSEIAVPVEEMMAEDYSFHLKRVPLAAEAISRIAHNVSAWFDLEERLEREDRLTEVKARLREIATRDYTWRGIAESYHRLYSATPVGPTGRSIDASRAAG